jgi:hypothetical protein
MHRAMKDVGIVYAELEQALFRTADFMRNKTE